MHNGPFTFTRHPLPSVVVTVYHNASTMSVSLLGSVFGIVAVSAFERRVVHRHRRYRQVTVLILRSSTLCPVKITRRRSIDIKRVRFVNHYGACTPLGSCVRTELRFRLRSRACQCVRARNHFRKFKYGHGTNSRWRMQDSTTVSFRLASGTVAPGVGFGLNTRICSVAFRAHVAKVSSFYHLAFNVLQGRGLTKVAKGVPRDRVPFGHRAEVRGVANRRASRYSWVDGQFTVNVPRVRATSGTSSRFRPMRFVLAPTRRQRAGRAEGRCGQGCSRLVLFLSWPHCVGSKRVPAHSASRTGPPRRRSTAGGANRPLQGSGTCSNRRIVTTACAPHRLSGSSRCLRSRASCPGTCIPFRSEGLLP